MAELTIAHEHDGHFTCSLLLLHDEKENDPEHYPFDEDFFIDNPSLELHDRYLFQKGGKLNIDVDIKQVF